MPYLGNTPTTQSFVSGTDYFNGTGAQTAFTLSRTVASVNDIQVTVNNVVQQPNDAYTLSGTTLTMTSAPSAGTNNVYVRYLSTTTQVITPSQNTVSWNTLDSNIQQDLGVMFKNRIINGNMVIDQRNAGASTTPTSSSYFIDRWATQLNVSSKFSVQQLGTTPPSGFINYMRITSLSAYSLAAGDVAAIYQAIEGLNTADLNWGSANAKTVTLSFWVRSSLTGAFGGTIQNSGQARSYPYSYTINSANTWEYKTVTITGDTTGTWLTTTGIGVYVKFSLGVGSTFTGAANAWTSTLLLQPTGSTSLISTNGATLDITGVQLEVGTQATAFSTAGGSYGAELALCQRYALKYNTDAIVYAFIGTGYATSTTNANISLPLPVQMRTAPTVTASTLMVQDGTTITAVTATAVVTNQTNSLNAFVQATVASGLTAFRPYQLQTNNSTSGNLLLSAEL